MSPPEVPLWGGQQQSAVKKGYQLPNITNHFNVVEVLPTLLTLNMVSSLEIMTGTCVSTPIWFSE
jgi:hypothetical protein